MLPITRGNLQNFCRVCLLELSTFKEPSQKISSISLNKVLPQSICNNCQLKLAAFKEFQRKTIFSTGVLRLIFDDEKSKLLTEASLKRLLKYCRVCLRRQSIEQYNIRKCQEICLDMFKCTGIQLVEDRLIYNSQSKASKKDAIMDDLRFPDALCNRCYATLKSFTQFKSVSKQTADYLKNILNKHEEDDVAKGETNNNKDPFDIQEVQIAELMPAAESNHERETKISIGSPPEPQAKYFCEIETTSFLTCIQACSDLSDTEKTIKSSIYKSEDDSSSDNSKKQLATIKKNEKIEPKLRCIECNSSFRKQFLYGAHIKSIHQGIENSFACPHCVQFYMNVKSLQRHISSSHKSNNNIKSYICKYCGRVFKRNVNLREHISTVHQQLKPFHCSTCGKAFGTTSTLMRHERNHSTEKPFSCEYCGKRYNSKSDLNVHIQRHTADPDLLCPICKRVQPNKKELEQHIERHSKTYQCTICGKIFRKMVNLREHVDVVHLKQKFKCSFCILAFSARKSLKNHELSHKSTNWPEVCLDCKLYFKSKHSLLIHLKKIHSKPLESKNVNCEKCLFCSCSFETKESLLQHMKKLHPFNLRNNEPLILESFKLKEQ